MSRLPTLGTLAAFAWSTGDGQTPRSLTMQDREPYPRDYAGLTLTETITGADLTAEHIGARIVVIAYDGMAFFGVACPARTDPDADLLDGWRTDIGFRQGGCPPDYLRLDETVEVWR